MKKTMKYKIFLLLAALSTVFDAAALKRPRLVVQIVVGSMRAEDLERYADNFSGGGFRRLVEGGTVYADARYDFQQTLTPVSLATLTTGALPSAHGIVGTRWRDYVDNRAVELIAGREGPGAYQMIAPTLTEALLQSSPGSKAVTVASEATSAVMMTGRGTDAFWLDSVHCTWVTSPYYAADEPDWVWRNNRERYNLGYITPEWRASLGRDKYRNTRRRDIVLPNEEGKTAKGAFPTSDYERLLYTPAGNTAVFGFAKQVIAQYKLGDDEKPDLLNICLDASRRIAEVYGPESIEMEDMYYRLDRDLADFLKFVFAQVKNGEATVVLTSDHGTSPSYDSGREVRDRFNVRQFEVIVNGFLNARYGNGRWVLEYTDKSLYLNHNLIYERGLDLAAVQNEVAVFAMQFRGVSHAQSATAMRTSYFGSGYARLMQNSFYPRRSGDVLLNLMPGWIEEREGCCSLSGSMYGYDTAVPLLFYGTEAGILRVQHRVGLTDVAPTLARLMGITEPAASEGSVLQEIVDL